MTVHLMTTFSEASVDESEDALLSLGFQLLNQGGYVYTTVGVRDNGFFKEVYMRADRTYRSRYAQRAYGYPLPDVGDEPVCVSIRSLTLFPGSPGDVTSSAVIGFLDNTNAGGVYGIPVSGVQFSQDGFSVRTVYRSGSASAVISDYVPLPSPWVFSEPNTIEFYRKSDGSVSLHFNGVEVEGVSLTYYPYFGFSTASTHEGETLSFGQLVVSTSPIGIYQIKTLKPSADTESDFTPDTGTECFSRINENPPDGDESYIAATDPGAKAVFNYADAEGNPLELGPNQGVLAIKHTVQARNEVPDARTLKSVYRKNGVDTPTESGVQVTGEYQVATEFIEMNPATGTAWQPEDFTDWAFGFMIEEDA